MTNENLEVNHCVEGCSLGERIRSETIHFASGFDELQSKSQPAALRRIIGQDEISGGCHRTNGGAFGRDGLSYVGHLRFFKTVSASSERAEIKLPPSPSSFVSHLNPSQSTSLSASSVTVGSTAMGAVPPASPSSPQIMHTSPKDMPTSGQNVEQTLSVQLPLNHPQHVYDKMHFKTVIRREGEFACGWGAAFINICVTFPLNKAMFRQQLHGISGIKAISQLHKDGLRYLYRGMLPPLMQKTTSLSIMFGMYYRCQDMLHERAPGLNVYVNHTLAALMSGTIEAAFTPFERIQSLMQTSQFHDKFANTFDALINLRKTGLREYYRGLSLIILRNGPSNVAFFLGREQLQLRFIHYNSNTEKVIKDFISGACLGAIISTFFFPLNVVKTHMQCKLGGEFDGIIQTFKVVWNERNRSLRGLFRGMHLNYTRSFISWGIINASFEFLMKTFFTLPHEEDLRLS